MAVLDNVRVLGWVAVVITGAVLLMSCGGWDEDDDNNNGDGGSAGGVTAQQACDALAGKTVAGATLAGAAVAASGVVPIYCKVNGTIAPSLNFEMRLPQNWNGKLYYGGGSGYNGSIPPLNLPALNQGYAQVSSDSGHQGSGLNASFALNDPYAAQLFGSLSIPTVMSSALEIVRAAYATNPTKSYFEGCGNGGREALMNVQRYPNLFDGVIARAPAYNWVGHMGAFNRTAKALAAPGGAFSAAKTATLAAAILSECDGLDDIVDGVVSNPAACNDTFNPASLRCVGGADTDDACLSDAQLAVVASWTADAEFTGSPAYRNAGWSFTGNENDPGAWATWATGNGNVTTALQYRFQDTTVKNYLARDRTAISLTYTPWDQNQNALFAMAALNDATNADLRPFRDSGAKLILWHGGNDAAFSTNSTAEYYNNVKRTVGDASTEAFVRFYIAPGVNHCAGGPGADTADLLGALDNWAVNGSAPGTLKAQKVDLNTGAELLARPLCQFPLYPRYTGPANDAEAAELASNYTCS